VCHKEQPSWVQVIRVKSVESLMWTAPNFPNLLWTTGSKEVVLLLVVES
jgi:hypothetical protein